MHFSQTKLLAHYCTRERFSWRVCQNTRSTSDEARKTSQRFWGVTTRFVPRLMSPFAVQTVLALRKRSPARPLAPHTPDSPLRRWKTFPLHDLTSETLSTCQHTLSNRALPRDSSSTCCSSPQPKTRPAPPTLSPSPLTRSSCREYRDGTLRGRLLSTWLASRGSSALRWTWWLKGRRYCSTSYIHGVPLVIQCRLKMIAIVLSSLIQFLNFSKTHSICFKHFLNSFLLTVTSVLFVGLNLFVR